MSELLEYKAELLNRIRLGSDNLGLTGEQNFFDEVSSLLIEAGIYDTFSKSDAPCLVPNKGMRVDAVSWNPLERIISAVVVDFSNSDEVISISQSEITKLGQRAYRFIESINNDSFFDSMAVTHPCQSCRSDIEPYLSQALKIRITILTDKMLSDRVKLGKLKMDPIEEKESFFEIWDLARIKNLDHAGMESEPFTIDFDDLCGGLNALPASIDQKGISSYLCILPGEVLWKLYDDFGQRLLESNVRTFLQFKGNANTGMRQTLLKNPENFFAFNNGLTVTATNISTKKDSTGNVVIKELENLQIVNGGQTTSAIYFGKLEKGTQRDVDFREIDLSKVFIQMKLTVIKDEEQAENMQSNIARFANTQNTIQKADFVSNHPLHKQIEALSRRIPAPPSAITNTSSKWFYERVRGQYQTSIRGFKGSSRTKNWEAEFPKNQKFSKMEMAKYENIWRMNPQEVSKGQQFNLIAVGTKLMNEWDKNESNFNEPFYKDLISKAILFKQADKAIFKSEWYKDSPGYKSQTVTYTISLLRYALKKQKKDLNLERIWKNQDLSNTLTREVINLGYLVQQKLLDLSFRNGVANTSEFAKKPDCWEKFKKFGYEIKYLESEDTLSTEEKLEKKYEDQKTGEISSEIQSYEIALSISNKEWSDLYIFLTAIVPESDKKMKMLKKLTTASKNTVLQLFEYEGALELRNRAISEGFVVPD
jgi:hypothetical protein